MQPVIGLAIDV